MCVKALEALRERYIELRDAGADYAALAGDVVIVDIEGYARDPKTGANVPHARRLTSHEERERERERETPPRLSGPWRAREGLFSLSRRKKERKEWPVEGVSTHHSPCQRGSLSYVEDSDDARGNARSHAAGDDHTLL